MSRWPVAAFVALALATIAAFFVTQHLKVSTPLLAGFPYPHPAYINPVDGRVCQGVDHRRMSVSFYLLNRSDDVDVDVVGPDGTEVAPLADGVHMQGGNRPVRRGFVWNGRTSSGTVAPDGIYDIKVTLIHQARYVLISNNAGVEPVTVQTVAPRPRVTGVSVAGSHATITYTGNQGLPGRILIYRTGGRLVKSFHAPATSPAVWDGTIKGRAAAPGRYLIALEVTDKACNTGTSARLPVTVG